MVLNKSKYEANLRVNRDDVEGYKTFFSFSNPTWPAHEHDKPFQQIIQKTNTIILESFPMPKGIEPSVANEEFLPNLYILYSFSRYSASLEGNFSEFGVHQGRSSLVSALTAVKYSSSSREFHLVDSFEGLSAPVRADGSFFKKSMLNNTDAEIVLQRLLSVTSGARLHKGFIPEVLNEIDSTTYSFVHIDVDLSEPTISVLEFVYEKMVTGGVILFDDFGFHMCPGVRTGVEKFFQDKLEKPISLPTGQAFVIISPASRR